MKIGETLPWKFTGAFKAVDGDYYIGTIVRENAGGIVELSHGSDPHSEEKINAVGKFIVESINVAYANILTNQPKE